MRTRIDYDAVVVGSGPNGLAAAITLARAGWSVLVVEGQETIGGGMRTLELTLPGFRHDICSAIHALGMGSPFFASLPLEEFGLRWIQPDIPLVHPLARDGAVALYRSIEETAIQLGHDSRTWIRLMKPLVNDWPKLSSALLAPLPVPRHPVAMARFGWNAVWPATLFARARFQEEHTRALFAGIAAHAIMPLEHPLTCAFGLMLGLLAHAVGWPLPEGGSQQIGNAMVAYLRSLDGEVQTGNQVTRLEALPSSRVILLNLTPKQIISLAGSHFPPSYRRRLERYRYGPGVFKIDYALSEPIPWQADLCHRAGTVHLGGYLDEIAASERNAWRGKHSLNPYVLVAQQSLFDSTRAPKGQHTGWAYCHVPHASKVDMTAAIEAQIERFAPGFQDCVLARHTYDTGQFETYNPNYVGGDINGGVQDMYQFWTRPVARLNPYSTPLDNLYICSSATPPGGGVHGMAGFHAARSILAKFGAVPKSAPPEGQSQYQI